METFAPRSLVNAHQSLPSLIGQGLLSGVMTVPTIPTFKFRPRLERLDWRRIRTVDVDRVARELDINTLQEHMAGVTFCSVEKEVCPHCQNPIDPVLLKVIQLVQLMVEYLLHWQDHLVISLQAAENKLKSLLQDREQLQKQLEKQADDMQTLKQELKQRKKIIASQEFMITAGLGGYHQCQHCDKAFLNSSFLQNHMQRQHPEQYDNRLTSETQSNVHSIKLEEEISKLKEQLTLTMSQLEAQQQTYLEQDQRCKEKELLKALEQWKDEEKERQKAQLEEMREMMLKEFKELSSKNALLQKKLYEMEEDSHKIWLDMTALQEEKVQLSVSMEERHRQDILKLQQQLKKKDEKWAFRMQKVQAMYKQEKEQFLHHLHRLHSSANTEEERNRKLVEKLERELQEQKKLILSQKEQIKKLTLNPPEYADKSTSPHVLDPVEDTSEKDGGKKTEIKKKKCGLRRSPIIKDLGPSVLQALLEEFRPLCTELFSIPEKKAKLKKQAQKSPVMRSPSVKELHPLLEQVLEELEPYCMELLHIIEKQAEVKKQTPKKTLRRSGIVKDLHPLFEQTLLEELEPTVKPDISRLSTVKEGTEQEKQEKRFSRFQQIREKLTQILRLRLKEKTDDNSSPEQHAQPRQLFGETPMRSRSGNLTTSMAQVVSRLLETRQRSHQPTQESYMSTPPKTSTPSVFSHSGFSKSRTPFFSSEKDFKEESPVQRPRASVTSVRGPDTLPADSDSEWMDGSDAETSHLQLRRHSSQNEDKPQGGLITDLMRNLERIFAEQSSTKPEEGVDVLSNKSNVRQKLEDSERDETDDLDSCSSEENRHLPKTGLLSKRTSVWGSSAGKTLKNQHGSPSL